MEPAELTAAREALGVTRYRLAKTLGVEQSTLSRWERGKRRIEHPEMLRLALLALQRGLG